MQICLDIYIVTWFCSMAYVRVHVDWRSTVMVVDVGDQFWPMGKDGVFSRWSRTVMEKEIHWRVVQTVSEFVRTLHFLECLKTLSWLCCYLSRLEVQGSLEVSRMQIPVLPNPRLGFIFEKRWFLRICSSKRHVGYADVATLPDLKFRRQKIVFKKSCI